jgi:hypothetical protein
MALSVNEQRVLNEIADRMAAEDPDYARRLSQFGGYETSALGMPGKWVALPVAILGIVLAAMAGLFFAVSTHGVTPNVAQIQHGLNNGHGSSAPQNTTHK